MCRRRVAAPNPLFSLWWELWRPTAPASKKKSRQHQRNLELRCTMPPITQFRFNLNNLKWKLLDMLLQTKVHLKNEIWCILNSTWNRAVSSDFFIVSQYNRWKEDKTLADEVRQCHCVIQISWVGGFCFNVHWVICSYIMAKTRPVQGSTIQTSTH